MAEGTVRMSAASSRKCPFWAVLPLFLSSFSIAQADLVVSEWVLNNRVETAVDGMPTMSDISRFISSAPIPFMDTQYNAIGNSTSRTTYGFGWSDNSGHFQIDGAQTAARPTASLVLAEANGSVNFVPAVDSMVSIHVQYTYYLPGAYMDAVGAGGLSDDQAGITYIDLFVHDFSFGPTSGYFDRTMSAIVPAGCRCDFGFDLRLVLNGPSDIAATDSGTVELSIAPLPEPAAFLPLGLGAVLVRRRFARG